MIIILIFDISVIGPTRSIATLILHPADGIKVLESGQMFTIILTNFLGILPGFLVIDSTVAGV